MTEALLTLDAPSAEEELLRRGRTAGVTAKPFLRWAGGKRQLVGMLTRLVPNDYRQRRYVEPFLGAGSLYFAMRPQHAMIADANPLLMQCYGEVRDRPEAVAGHLAWHSREHREEHYYAVRADYNRLRPSAAQAARFIYLNAAGFNGVFRVNLDGRYNVPYGRKLHPKLPDLTQLTACGSLLETADIRSTDYEVTLADVEAGDFVYLDPPYPALNETAYFAHYTRDRFTTAEQLRLADIVAVLVRRRCKVMMSNADVPIIRELYKGLTFREIDVTRFVSCKRKKHKVKEVVITNY